MRNSTPTEDSPDFKNMMVMNTNTKNIFRTVDGFVLIIRATSFNNKLINPMIYLEFL